MNTRRKIMQAKSDVPSTRWHLMHESFYPLFDPTHREHVEYWYNMVASGIQRDLFRKICRAIFAQNTALPDPIYTSTYKATAEPETVKLLLRNYGSVLSDVEGKPKTRAWLLHTGTSERDRNEFRSVFTGCQTLFEKRSVMHTDYVAPEPESYTTDRTHFVRSVDWNSLKDRQEMTALEAARRKHGGVVASQLDKSLALVESGLQQGEGRTSNAKPRVTKPKNQFDGVNMLASLGFDGVPAGEAVAQLTAKRDADRDAQWYYVDADGSTVYKARSTRGQGGGVPNAAAGSVGKDGILSSVTSDPMARWVNKTCD